jgi:hypothetical protein
VKRVHHHTLHATALQIGAIDGTDDAHRRVGQKDGELQLAVAEL